MKLDIINKSDFELPKYQTFGSAGMDLRADLKIMNEESMGTPIDIGISFEGEEPI